MKSAIIHKQGKALVPGRASFTDWIGLLSAEEQSKDTLIYLVNDVGFIGAVGMNRSDATLDERETSKR